MTEMEERYGLAYERIGQIPGEQLLPGNYQDYFGTTAEFLLEMEAAFRQVAQGELYRVSLEELRARNRKLYEDVLPEKYATSYADPAFAADRLGQNFGGLLSFLYTELRSLIVYAFEQDLFDATIRLELFLEIYQAFLCSQEDGALPDYEQVRQIVVSFMNDYAPSQALRRTARMVDAEEDFARRIIMESDLSDVRYLYYYGEYITEDELRTANHLARLPEETLRLLADTYTEGYRIGFQVTGKDITRKKTVNIRYALGFERLIRYAVENFEQMGLKPTFYRAAVSVFSGRTVDKNGFFGANPNKQFDYDHKEDQALFFDKAYLHARLSAQRAAFEEYKDKAAVFGGPAVQEVFGGTPFAPVNKKEALRLSEEQRKLSVEYLSAAGLLQNEYIPMEERSFTIIAFPVPAIGERYEEIFDEIVRINTLDYRQYQEIQQCLIDALDRAEYVLVKGMGVNRTDLRVALHRLEDPSKQTNFENCVADVNIPVGEVFTTPQLKGTEGILHVSRVFLNGLEYRDLSIAFIEGQITDYGCANFDTEEENRKYIQDNVLFHHDTLPLGEFAIGTNTTAYVTAGKYGIEDKLPILIAEKMGPHFAVGDTCYTRAEDVAVYNPDGKEIIARDNEITLSRKSDSSKAYFNCHTDITIPYDELGEVTAVTPAGERLPLIRKGRFVLPGCGKLNDAFAG